MEAQPTHLRPSQKTLEEAIEMIRLYRETCTYEVSRLMDPHLMGLKGFLINKHEIDYIFENAASDKLRIYLAMNETEQNRFDLIVVGATEVIQEDGSIVYRDEWENRQIYDLDAPCPPTCDVNSPLFLAGRIGGTGPMKK